MAEDAGEIVPLSNLILRQACFEAALRSERGVVAVNLSALHLANPDLVDTVRAALHASALPATRLAGTSANS